MNENVNSYLKIDYEQGKHKHKNSSENNVKFNNSTINTNIKELSSPLKMKQVLDPLADMKRNLLMADKEREKFQLNPISNYKNTGNKVNYFDSQNSPRDIYIKDNNYGSTNYGSNGSSGNGSSNQTSSKNTNDKLERVTEKKEEENLLIGSRRKKAPQIENAFNKIENNSEKDKVKNNLNSNFVPNSFNESRLGRKNNDINLESSKFTNNKLRTNNYQQNSSPETNSIGSGNSDRKEYDDKDKKLDSKYI